MQKNRKDKVCIVIPVYNEGKVIDKVLDELLKNGYKDIILVNDGSKDNTEQKIREFINRNKDSNITLLNHPINRGAGAATFTGITYVKRFTDCDYIVLIDGDGQHDPKDIEKLIREIKKGYDVVIGSRTMQNLENMPLLRRIANFVGDLVTFFFFGLLVKDSQSGFKALNRRAINKINITFDKFEFSSEMIGEIKKNNLKFTEVPIKVRYNKYTLSKKHGQSIKNGFKMIMRFLLR